MNIMISIEELQAYQKACEDRMKLEHEIKVVESIAMGMNGPFGMESVQHYFTAEREKLKRRLNEKPFPKLVPNV